MIFGSFLDYIALYLSSLGFEVVGFDLQKNILAHKNFKFVGGDFLETSQKFPDYNFDIAISVSSIEHVGLDVYGGPQGSELDLKVMKRISQLLSPEGILLMTVPFGKPGLYPPRKPFYRKYDIEKLKILLQDFSYTLRFFKLLQNENIWIPSDSTNLESNDGSKPTGVACVLGKKLREARSM